MEMYEQQDPFKLTDFVTISYFLNQFLYKAVLTNLFGECCPTLKRKDDTRGPSAKVPDVADVKSVSSNPLFTSLHTLLMAIYRRDCRRTFCPEGHWLAKLSMPALYLLYHPSEIAHLL